VTFSKIFGEVFKKEYKDERHFLSDQYFLAQQYIGNDIEEMQYALFNLENLSEPIYCETPEDNIDDVSKTKQVLFIQHTRIIE